MFCTNCGKQIPDGSAFCENCGSKQEVSGVNVKMNGHVQADAQKQGSTQNQNNAQGAFVSQMQPNGMQGQNGAPGQSGFKALSGMKKRNLTPKMMGIIGGSAGAVIVLIIILVVILTGPKTVELTDLVSVDFSGVDGFGKADIDIDEEQLIKRLTEAMGVKEKKLDEEDLSTFNNTYTKKGTDASFLNCVWLACQD